MNAAQIKLLTRIATATMSVPPYLMAADGIGAKDLEALGYIEVNRGPASEDVPLNGVKGKFAQRITDDGKAALATPAPAPVTEGTVDTPVTGDTVPVQPQLTIEQPTKPKERSIMSTFEISNDVALPVTTRTKADKYPFKQLQMGQSFFVEDAAADEDGNRKRLIAASTVTGANRRHKEAAILAKTDVQEAPYFTHRVTDEDSITGLQGVRVWRTARPVPKAKAAPETASGAAPE